MRLWVCVFFSSNLFPRHYTRAASHELTVRKFLSGFFFYRKRTEAAARPERRLPFIERAAQCRMRRTWDELQHNNNNNKIILRTYIFTFGRKWAGWHLREIIQSTTTANVRMHNAFLHVAVVLFFHFGTPKPSWYPVIVRLFFIRD